LASCFSSAELCSCSFVAGIIDFHHHAAGGIKAHCAVNIKSSSGAILSAGNQDHQLKVYHALIGTSGKDISFHTITSYHVNN
jgi:hypothetical protein